MTLKEATWIISGTITRVKDRPYKSIVVGPPRSRIEFIVNDFTAPNTLTKLKQGELYKLHPLSKFTRSIEMGIYSVLNDIREAEATEDYIIFTFDYVRTIGDHEMVLLPNAIAEWVAFKLGFDTDDCKANPYSVCFPFRR